MQIEAPLFIKDNNINVKFPKTNVIWFNEQIHFVDEYFNEYFEGFICGKNCILVYFKSEENAIGEFVTLKITRANGISLYGDRI